MINATATAFSPIPSAKEIFFKNILVATDFSPASDQAVEYAASLARRYGSAIYLTHVVTLDGYPLISPEYAAMMLEKKHSEVKTYFRETLQSGDSVASLSRLLRKKEISGPPSKSASRRLISTW